LTEYGPKKSPRRGKKRSQHAQRTISSVLPDIDEPGKKIRMKEPALQKKEGGSTERGIAKTRKRAIVPCSKAKSAPGRKKIASIDD